MMLPSFLDNVVILIFYKMILPSFPKNGENSSLTYMFIHFLVQLVDLSIPGYQPAARVAIIMSLRYHLETV